MDLGIEPSNKETTKHNIFPFLHTPVSPIILPKGSSLSFVFKSSFHLAENTELHQENAISINQTAGNSTGQLPWVLQNI